MEQKRKSRIRPMCTQNVLHKKGDIDKFHWESEPSFGKMKGVLKI